MNILMKTLTPLVMLFAIGCSVNGDTTDESKKVVVPTPTPAPTPNPSEQNGVGGSGAPLETGITTSFVLFQDNFTSNLVNRDGGAVKANGISSLYSMGAFADPNDSNKLKFLAVDRANHRILIFNSIPTSGTAAADVVVGQPNMTTGTVNSGLGMVTAAGFNDPVSVSVCTNGALLVTDRNNHRILGFNSIPKTNGASADFAVGQSSLTTNASGLNAGALNGPYGAGCMDNKLFVNDRGNNRILVFNSIPTSSGGTANFAIGQPDLTTGSGGCTSQKLNIPYEILLFDSKLYVADGGNHRVLMYNSMPTASNPSADVVVGQANFTSCSINRGTTASAQTMHFPNTLAAKGNKIAIGDNNNNRVLFFNLPLTTDQAAFAQHGQPDFATTALVNPPTETSVGGTKGLIFEGSNMIWIGDAGNRRVKVVALPY